MRITHVIDYFHTDVGYQEYYLAKYQARLGHHVRVISTTHRHHTVAVAGPDEARGAQVLADAGVDLVRLPARQLGHDRAWIHGLRRTLLSEPTDVIHAHGPFSPTTARVALAAQRKAIPLLVDNHVQETGAPGSMSSSGRLFYAAFRATAGRVLRSSVGSWVADGPEKAQFLETRLAIGGDRIELVPLGFDPEIFSFDRAERDRQRRSRGWSSDVVVAVTGKLHPGKRVDLVAAACERASATTEMRLVIAGELDPSYARVVETAAPGLAASGRLEVLPMQRTTALAALYQAADVVAFARLPSISTFEAAGTGAVVALGDDPFAGWLASMSPVFLSTDPAHLELAFDGWGSREERAHAAAATFGWDAISRRFVELYEAMQ